MDELDLQRQSKHDKLIIIILFVSFWHYKLGKLFLLKGQQKKVLKTYNK